MKSIAMIAYFFPPEGCAGVYRPLRFLRELTKKGWSATVICADPYRHQRYDPDLLARVPQEARIISVRGRDPWQAIQARRGNTVEEKLFKTPSETAQRIVATHHSPFRSRLRESVRTLEGWCYRPDMAMPWIRPALKEIVRVCKNDRPDVMWATIGPVSSGVVAHRASLGTGVPYVVDFRDPWGLNYYESEVRRPSWAKYMDNRMMHRMLRSAQAVIFLSQSVAECYLHFFDGAMDESKIHIIPNGFDGEIQEFIHAPGDKCRILYTGTLSTYRYDTLLQALSVLKTANFPLTKHLEVLFVGEGLEALEGQVEYLGISDMVKTSPPTSYAEINRLQQEAHALLVLGRNPERKGHELLVGAKLFVYFKAGRPIVGVVPQDETRKVLHRIGVTTVADANSVSEIAVVLRDILSRWSIRMLASLVPDRKACQAYSSEQQTEALERALEGVSPRERFLWGTCEIPPSLRGSDRATECLS